MALSNHNGLVNAVLRTLNRISEAGDPDSIEDDVKQWIEYAEVDINNALRVRQMVREGRTYLNEQREWLPSDFLEPKSCVVRHYYDSTDRNKWHDYPLQYRTLDVLAKDDYTYYPQPTFFSIMGNRILVRPDPMGTVLETTDETLSAEDLLLQSPNTADEFQYDTELVLTYYAQVPPLRSSADTNDVLKYYPSIYLYSTLVHSAPFLHDDARIQTWSALVQQRIAEANDRALRAEHHSLTLQGEPSHAGPYSDKA